MSGHRVCLGPFAAMSEAMRASSRRGTGAAAVQAFPHLACAQAPPAVADVVLKSLQQKHFYLTVTCTEDTVIGTPC